MGWSMRKFRDLSEMENCLNGGILGVNVSRGVAGLIGKTLIFTTPDSVTVTFAHSSKPADMLLDQGDALFFSDIKAQIEAVATHVKVYQIGGCLAFVHKATPIAQPISITVNSSALSVLGFDDAAALTGRLVYPPESTDTPRFAWESTTNDGAHALWIWEG